MRNVNLVGIKGLFRTGMQHDRRIVGFGASPAEEVG